MNTEARRDYALYKLALCARCIENDEAGLAEDPAHAATWRRLIAEARGDALYWAVDLWLCGERYNNSLNDRASRVRAY
jgi:hypothetical protein